MSKAKNKTIPTALSVSKYLNNIEDKSRRADCKKLHNWMRDLSNQKGKMWGTSIVGYGQYHYKYDSGREGDFMKIGFSSRKNAITLYIMPGFERYEGLMKQLGKYKTGKSCLYIKQLVDIDEEILQTLLQESYAYMTKKYG